MRRRYQHLPIQLYQLAILLPRLLDTEAVLEKVFPQGLDAHDPDHVRNLRAAFDEWELNLTSQRANPAIHKAWIDYVLKQTLGLPESVIAEGQAISQTLKATVSEHGETLRPDVVVPPAPCTSRCKR